MISPLSSTQANALLGELCQQLGFCPSPDILETLTHQPPPDPESFTHAVIQADGLDPLHDISLRLQRQVRAIVRAHFHQADNARQETCSP